MTVKPPVDYPATRSCPQCHLCSVPEAADTDTACTMCGRYNATDARSVDVGGDRPALRYEGTAAGVAGRQRAAATMTRNGDAT